MVVGGSQQKTLDPGFVLLGTSRQDVPVILGEMVLPDGFDFVSPSLTVKDWKLIRSLPQKAVADGIRSTVVDYNLKTPPRMRKISVSDSLILPKNIGIIYKSKLSNIFPEIYNKMNGNRNNSRHLKTYKVQHLRTFEVTPKNVLPNTQTAVELLMQGCYTYVRSFNMSIDDNNGEPYLILSDPRNGNAEVERFRIGRILYPRYRITPPDVCPVNNLLTFTIKAGSMDDGRPRRNEIHLFQVTQQIMSLFRCLKI
ncbi:unnamed protein product [Schistosoma margrebowiei]|uniref:Uncharacterized protein n=1 Tax=Schistosoma margrebowiei TaxID=48269 RepID=A0A183LJF2_9TREM|nr:unnamed protein product [Schistosoma margrebowiei]